MAEKEYIDREAAIERFTFKAIDRFGMEPTISASNVRAAIAAIPAADVRPVVRGHWITEEEALQMDDYFRSDTCSVCGRCDWDCTESSNFNFCPNCGADMREES